MPSWASVIVGLVGLGLMVALGWMIYLDGQDWKRNGDS